MFLPEHRYTGPFNDDEWLKEQLAMLPFAWRMGVATKYSKVFLESGRREANIRLRKYIKRIQET